MNQKKTSVHIQAEWKWVLHRKVPTDDRYTTQPRHSLSIEHRLVVFQDLVSEVKSGLVPVWVWGEQGETHYCTVRRWVSYRVWYNYSTLHDEIRAAYTEPQYVEGAPGQQQVQPFVGGILLHQAHDTVWQETQPSNSATAELKKDGENTPWITAQVLPMYTVLRNRILSMLETNICDCQSGCRKKGERKHTLTLSTWGLI